MRHLTIQLLRTTARLLVTRFIPLSTQWMKEMRTWGWSEITSYFFWFGVNQVHCFGLKPGAWWECLMCNVPTKITDLRGRLKFQQGGSSWAWYYVLIVVGPRLIPCIRGLLDSAIALNRRRPSPIPRRAEHHSVNSSEIVKFLLKTNDGRGERPVSAILSATYVSAKTRECKGSI